MQGLFAGRIGKRNIRQPGCQKIGGGDHLQAAFLWRMAEDGSFYIGFVDRCRL